MFRQESVTWIINLSTVRDSSLKNISINSKLRALRARNFNQPSVMSLLLHLRHTMVCASIEERQYVTQCGSLKLYTAPEFPLRIQSLHN